MVSLCWTGIAPVVQTATQRPCGSRDDPIFKSDAGSVPRAANWIAGAVKQEAETRAARLTTAGPALSATRLCVPVKENVSLRDCRACVLPLPGAHGTVGAQQRRGVAMSMQTMSWYLEAMAVAFWLVIGTRRAGRHRDRHPRPGTNKRCHSPQLPGDRAFPRPVLHPWRILPAVFLCDGPRGVAVQPRTARMGQTCRRRAFEHDRLWLDPEYHGARNAYLHACGLSPARRSVRQF